LKRVSEEEQLASLCSRTSWPGSSLRRWTRHTGNAAEQHRRVAGHRANGVRR